MTAALYRSSLVRELLSDPKGFKDKGRAYQLLDEYFAGAPVRTLRPLLRHEEPLVRHAAVWVASELGSGSCELLDEIVPLAESEDRYLAYHALEILLICGVAERSDRFLSVARALESKDSVIRGLAMRLMTKADKAQLEACNRGGESLSEENRRGLRWLVSGETSGPDKISEMLGDESAVLRRYGAIALKRSNTDSAIAHATAGGNLDPEIAQFLRT